MHYLEKLKNITTLVFDIDGVLTDGMVTIMPNGDQVRALNSKDCFAIQLAVKKGMRVCVITGGNSENVKQRLQALGVNDVYLRVKDKLPTLEDILVMYDLSADEVMYMGDDLPDFEVMERVGIPACPSDAAREIRDIATYISDAKGGNGCARDIIEKTLRAQRKWITNPTDIQW